MILRRTIKTRTKQKTATIPLIQIDRVSRFAAAHSVDGIPAIIADSSDNESVLALVHSTRVVLSVADPYALYSTI